MTDLGAQFLLKFYRGQDLKYGDVPVDGFVRVGRHPQNDVVLNHISVSRYHATFLLEPHGNSSIVLLRDEGSTNGCVVNGRSVRRGEILVKPGDCIQVGVFLVEIEERRSEHLPLAPGDPAANIVFETSPSSQTALPNQRLRVLYELASRISFLDGPELLQVATGAIAECMPFSVLSILLESESGPPATFTRTPAGPCASTRVSVSRSLINKCRNEGVAILAGSGVAQEHDFERTTVLQSVKSAMCVPLLSHGRNFGVIYASSPSEIVYNREDLQFLILAASNVTHKLAATRAIHVVEAEKDKLETILENLQEGVILLDSEFRILTVNAAALQALGGGIVLGKRLDDAFSGFRHSLSLQALPSLTSFQIEETAPAEQSTGTATKPPRVYAGTIGRNDGSTQAAWQYVICLRDISQARHMERMKSLFINRLAHKIVTPLTVVTGVNFLMAEQMHRFCDPELSKILTESLRQSEQCSALIRQFVDCTAIGFGSGSSTLEWTTCRLETLVEAALTSNADLISNRDFKVVSLFQEGATEVYGDQAKLGLVFHHLVQNAAKFGKEGGTLMIGAQAEKKMLRVSFLDDGPGIPPEEMQNVGQMFYQVDPHNTGEVPGAGFGLWLVHEIVRSHGGEVKLSSPSNAEGVGTLVDVSIPGVTKETSLAEPASTVTVPFVGGGA